MLLQDLFGSIVSRGSGQNNFLTYIMYRADLGQNPQPCLDPSQIRMARWPKTAVVRLYWRRGLALDKTGESVVCVVCTAGTFIRCEDEAKSGKIIKG